MKLRIDEQLIIIAAGIGGGVLAYLAALYVLPLLPVSDEFLYSFANQNIRAAIFIAGFLLVFLLSLLLGALVPALWVGFKQHSAVFPAGRLYGLGVLFIVTVTSLGPLSGRNAAQWFGLYFAQVIVLMLASYGMVWLGALAGRLTPHSKGSR
jgi:hypothetical protein